MRAQEFEVRFVGFDWPRFGEAADLRYAVLQAPFGVERSDDWNDEDPASRHIVALAADGADVAGGERGDDSRGEVGGPGGGPVVGYARLIERGDAQIRQVAVDPAWQGAGVGRELMVTLIAQARADGIREIWLNARVPAIGFYERLGFEVVSDVFQTGRTTIPHCRMEYRGPGTGGR